MTKEDLIEFVSTNRQESVIKILRKTARDHPAIFEQVNMLSASYYALKEEQVTQVLSSQDISQRKAQINRGLLSILQQLPEDITFPEPDLPTVPTPFPAAGISNRNKWLLSILLLLVIGLVTWRFFPKSSPKYQRLTVNLHKPGNIQDNPVQEGLVALTAVRRDYDREAVVDAQGRAVFDSIPVEMNGEDVALELAAEKFVLKNPGMSYAIQEKINAEVESPPPPIAVAVTSPPIQQVPRNTACPSTPPPGKGKPAESRTGNVWQPGHYTGTNCRWVDGEWKEVPKPVNSPNGYVENNPTRRTGFSWVRGQYIWQNDAWSWKAGSWVRMPGVQIRAKIPAPTYVPPLKPATY